ncbi:MAG: transketolase [Thermoplasmatota archaeon]
MTTPALETEPSEEKLLKLELTALEMRRLIVDMVYEAGSGHPGGSLGITDVMAALYFSAMRHDPANPKWEKRDRLIMSKGHCCPAWYAALAIAGYFPRAELKTLRKIDSRLQGHPDMRKTPGIEFNGGSEGQGLSGAVGMALAAKLDGSKHRVYCIIGDGECQAGPIWEAAGTASHYRLDNLVGILDRNGLQIDGPTEEILSIEPIAERWRAFGWHVIEIDGHNLVEVLDALEKARRVGGKPTMLIASTVKGKGVSYMEGTLSFHGKAPSKDELAKAMTELDLWEKRIWREHGKEPPSPPNASSPSGAAASARGGQ